MAKSQPAVPQDSQDVDIAGEVKRGTPKKGRPTPSRKAQQAARARPLVVDDRKAARKVARQQELERREAARIGMAAGDERYLPARDKGPQRRFIRDRVDARTSIAEFILPFMLLVLLASSFNDYRIIVIAQLSIWGFIAVSALDIIVFNIGLKRKLAQEFGSDAVESGFRFYAMMRMLQLRVLRLPKPQVDRKKPFARS